MKITFNDFLKMLKQGDLVFTENGNYRIKEKSETDITIERMGGTK